MKTENKVQRIDSAKPHLVFAYGSNMFRPQMNNRCPDAIGVCSARLKGFKLTFGRSTKKGGGALDVIPALGRVVWGAIYRINTADLNALDKFEGCGYAYERVPMIVVTAYGEEMLAWVYRVIDPSLSENPPTQEYTRKCVMGMQEWNIPYWYRVSFIDWVNGIGYFNRANTQLPSDYVKRVKETYYDV